MKQMAFQGTCKWLWYLIVDKETAPGSLPFRSMRNVGISLLYFTKIAEPCKGGEVQLQ